MSTDKYELEEVAYGTTGWNGILTTNHQKVDDNLHTYLLIVLGETVSISDALYLNADGKWYKARGDVMRQPSWGLAVDAGILDQEIRMQRIGPFTDAAWTWTPGRAVWLDPATAGALTQTKPPANAQFMGMAQAVTILMLAPDFNPDLLGTTTTTTSTTTTTTT
jgi:hypothetical protein